MLRERAWSSDSFSKCLQIAGTDPGPRKNPETSFGSTTWVQMPKLLGLPPLLCQVHEQGAASEVEPPGLKTIEIWDTGATGCVLMFYDAAPVPHTLIFGKLLYFASVWILNC